MAIINARHSSGAQAVQVITVSIGFHLQQPATYCRIKYSKLDCGDEKNKVKHKFLNDFLLLFEVLLAPMRQDPVPTPNK